MFENLQFNPAETYQKLLDNSKAMEELSQRIMAKRNEVVILEAQLMDAKADSFRSRRLDYGITEAKEWQKIDAVKEEKAFIKGEAELRNLTDQMRVLEAVNNNYKMAIKIVQTEITNLNLA